MFTIYPSSSTPTEKITVSFATHPTSGTSGTPVTFSANAAASDQYPSDTFTYNFIWGDGTSTGFGTSLSATKTYSNTSTQTFQVTLQAKCSHGVIGQATANISITGSGGGGGTGSLGSKTNPVKLDQSTSMAAGGYPDIYGYDYNWSKQYTIPKGQSVWFMVDPYGFLNKTGTDVGIVIKNYSQQTNVSFYLYRENRSTGVESPPSSQRKDSSKGLYYLGNYWSTFETAFNANEYYLVQLTENGTKDTPMSIMWGLD